MKRWSRKPDRATGRTKDPAFGNAPATIVRGWELTGKGPSRGDLRAAADPTRWAALLAGFQTVLGAGGLAILTLLYNEWWMWVVLVILVVVTGTVLFRAHLRIARRTAEAVRMWRERDKGTSASY